MSVFGALRLRGTLSSLTRPLRGLSLRWRPFHGTFARPFISFATAEGSKNGPTSATTVPPITAKNGVAAVAAQTVANAEAARSTDTPPQIIQSQSMPTEEGDKTTTITRRYTHRTISEPSIKTGGDYTLPHPIWKTEFLNTLEVTHRPPQSAVDAIALWTIRIMRFNFDVLSGYLFFRKTEQMWLNRMIYLETVAGVPGSIGATVRHLASLRRLKRDHGWIHTLLEEAENERMHLLTAIKLREPGKFFRFCILLTQGIFFNFYWIAYLLHPKFCHRLVGYLEEEAVKTYTTCLKCIDADKLWEGVPAPDIAIKYWRLPSNAMMRDVIANIRADEAHHRDVNHAFADLNAGHPNPYGPGH
jgi:hypothetical protein